VEVPTLSWNASSGGHLLRRLPGHVLSAAPGDQHHRDQLRSGSAEPGRNLLLAVAARNDAGTSASDTWSFTTSQPAQGLHFVPVTPCRLADTRGSSPSRRSSRDFAVPQLGCGIPETALAYSLNVTAVPKEALSYLTLWPTGASRPGVSTLNS